jgi:hypothetical protein
MKKDRNNDRVFEQFKNLKIVQLHNKKHEEQLLRSIYARKDKPTRLFNIFSFNPVPVIAGIIIVIIIGAGLLWWLPPVFFPNDLQAQGSVYIEESNGNRNITEVSKIRAGMDIRTLRDGRLNWKLNEKSRVVLHKNTELKITELRQSEESWQSRFDLQKGSIDCQITLPGKNSRFIILTPVLEITVTGTRFSVTVDDAGNSTVSVEKGKVLCNPFYNLSRQLEADQDISADKKSLLKQLIENEIPVVTENTSMTFGEKAVKQRTQIVKKQLGKLLEHNTEVSEVKQGIIESLQYILAEENDEKENNPEKVRNGIEKEENPDNPVSDRSTGGRIDINSSVETGSNGLPTGWKPLVQSPAYIWSGEQVYTGKKSLKITLNEVETRLNAWRYTYRIKMPEQHIIGAEIFIKTKDIVGDGIRLTLEAYNGLSDRPVLTATSKNMFLIKGTKDWTFYKLLFPGNTDHKIKYIVVRLIMLPGTTGTAYFDDIYLIQSK